MAFTLPHRAAQKLREFRRAQHPALTQEGLAGELGVSRSQVARWETGAGFPSMAQMEAMRSRGICEPNDWLDPPGAAEEPLGSGEMAA